MFNTQPSFSLFGAFQESNHINTKLFPNVKDPFGILEVNEQYQQYMSLIKPVKHLMGGTKAMKENSRDYIRQEEGESDTGYQNRVSRAKLYQFFNKTCSRISGEIFKHEVKMLKINNRTELTQAQMDMLDDIDMSGNNLHVFLASCMQSAIPYGGVHVLVNEFSPNVIEVGEGRFRKKMYYNAKNGRMEDYTAGVEKSFGVRPFLSIIKPENVLPPIIYVRNEGKKIPALFRVYDEILLPHPESKYKFQKVKRVISFEHRLDISPDATPEYSVFHIEEEYNATSKSMDSTVKLVRGPVKLNSKYLTIFSFFTTEEVNGVPISLALQDVIDLNILHFQSTTDQRNILHYARMITYFGRHLKSEDNSFTVVGNDFESAVSDPIAENLRLSMEGQAADTPDIPLGCNILVHSTHDHGDLKAVETSGAAIGAGRQDLQDIEANISFFSNSMFSDKRNRVSATERVQNTQETYSDPQTWAIRFKDFASTVCSELFGAKCELSMNVEISPDFNSEKARLIFEAAGKTLPTKIVIEEIMKRGLLHSVTYSPDDLYNMLMNEIAEKQKAESADTEKDKQKVLDSSNSISNNATEIE
jgi:hypothetical protein